MTRIGIIGGTGYTGGELARLLCRHPGIEIAAMTSRQNAGRPVSEVHPYLKGYVDLAFTERISDTKDLDLVFVATPHGVAMSEVPPLLEQGVKAIDLSGDYRLRDPELYEKWYGHQHTDVDNLRNAVYGLPELFRDRIRGADLVANPGCYATSAILACAPLMKSGLVEDDVVVDSKSGTSGAGMVPSARTHHPNCSTCVIPYSIGTHRHTPEIEQNIAYITGKDLMKPETWQYINFQPHLLPQVRGIEVTIYATCDRDFTNEEVYELYKDFYKNEPFVKVFPASLPVQTKWVYGTNFCEMTPTFDARTHRLIVSSVIDNIGKGAAGQAIQNMNLIMGLPETTGLMMPPMYP